MENGSVPRRLAKRTAKRGGSAKSNKTADAEANTASTPPLPDPRIRRRLAKRRNRLPKSPVRGHASIEDSRTEARDGDEVALLQSSIDDSLNETIDDDKEVSLHSSIDDSRDEENVSTRNCGLVITFLDIGQGNATLVECPGGESILIDCGSVTGRETRKELCGYARNFISKRTNNKIDYLVVSHADKDHMNLASTILAGMTIENFLCGGQSEFVPEKW